MARGNYSLMEMKYRECHVDAWVKDDAAEGALDPMWTHNLPLSAPQDAQISVHTIGGTTFLVNVSLQWNFLFDVILAIADLKVLKGIEFDQMKLTQGGRRLNEKLCHCLADYGVKHGSELGLVVVPMSDKCEICDQKCAHDIDDICSMCARCAEDVSGLG